MLTSRGRYSFGNGEWKHLPGGVLKAEEWDGMVSLMYEDEIVTYSLPHMDVPTDRVRARIGIETFKNFVVKQGVFHVLVQNVTGHMVLRKIADKTVTERSLPFLFLTPFYNPSDACAMVLVNKSIYIQDADNFHIL